MKGMRKRLGHLSKYFDVLNHQLLVKLLRRNMKDERAVQLMLKLKTLSSRKKCQSIKPSLEEIKGYTGGWLNYYESQA